MNFIYLLNNIARITRSFKIRIYGFIMKQYLSSCGKKCRMHYPSRIWDGYNISIGDNFSSMGNLYLYGNGGKIIIGDNASINTNVIFGSSYSSITIGNNVLIGPNVVFRASNHNIEKGKLIRDQKHSGAPIIVHDDVWIGSNAVILPGVVLEKGCVIAAGAIVTKNVKKENVVGGVPAKIISIRLKKSYE